jgi:hypothetical protein
LRSSAPGEAGALGVLGAALLAAGCGAREDIARLYFPHAAAQHAAHGASGPDPNARLIPE